MSAWIVPDIHIDALVTWAVANRVSYYFDEIRKGIAEDPQKVAGILYAANVASVNHRYDEDTPTDDFTFKRLNPVVKDPVVILKACDCFDYQSCELDSYEYQSEAWKIINAIRQKAITQLPGYSEAPGWPIGGLEPEPEEG